MRTAHKAALCLTAALAAALTFGGCVYRLDTQQGNLLDDDQVQQVEVGMTRSQVRFLLGTPMVSDPFSPDRWDYMYFYRYGRGGKVRKSHVVVFFDGDVVSRIDRPAAAAAVAPAPAAPEEKSPAPG
jgi:outer membrane protein assembly factor BamE